MAANRGASGIDGVLSTAAGWAEGLGRGATLLVGDVSFLHDVNGLNLLRTAELRPPLTVRSCTHPFQLPPLSLDWSAWSVFRSIRSILREDCKVYYCCPWTKQLSLKANPAVPGACSWCMRPRMVPTCPCR